MKQPIGQNRRHLPRYRPQDAERHKRQLERAVQDETPEIIHTSRAGGDKRQLRGIPVVGATTGAVPGTNPLQAILDKEDPERLAC